MDPRTLRRPEADTAAPNRGRAYTPHTQAGLDIPRAITHAVREATAPRIPTGRAGSREASSAEVAAGRALRFLEENPRRERFTVTNPGLVLLWLSPDANMEGDTGIPLAPIFAPFAQATVEIRGPWARCRWYFFPTVPGDRVTFVVSEG